tara:strand:+ start:1997 stop:3319 length:1323 start_codon:yes stop_codon:yes gene_type:complete
MLKISSESSFLIDYYDKKLELNIPNKKSNELENLQKHIYDKLDNIYGFLNKDLCNIKNLRKIYNDGEREYKKLLGNAYKKNFTDNPFIDTVTKEFIHNTPATLIVYTLPYKNKIININFVEYSKISQPYLSNLDKIVKNMLAQIYLVSQLSTNGSCSKDGISVIIFMSPYKRELEKKQGDILGAKNANGGFCYGCKSKGEIIVYRKEEFLKVFSHELIHNFGLDTNMWKFMAAAKVNNSKEYKIYNKFIDNYSLDEENDIVPQEALVEFWGVFLNNTIYSYVYSNNCNLSTHKQKLKIFKEMFKKIMEFEITHSLLQTTKILQHNNISYLDILSTDKDISYRENTYIFSYYMLKLFLLYNYSAFINTNITTSNGNSIYFQNSLVNMEQFFNYLNSVSNSKSLIDNLKYMEKHYIFLKSQKKSREIKYLISNLRMSVLEYY